MRPPQVFSHGVSSKHREPIVPSSDALHAHLPPSDLSYITRFLALLLSCCYSIALGIRIFTPSPLSDSTQCKCVGSLSLRGRSVTALTVGRESANEPRYRQRWLIRQAPECRTLDVATQYTELSVCSASSETSSLRNKLSIICEPKTTYIRRLNARTVGRPVLLYSSLSHWPGNAQPYHPPKAISLVLVSWSSMHGCSELVRLAVRVFRLQSRLRLAINDFQLLAPLSQRALSPSSLYPGILSSTHMPRYRYPYGTGALSRHARRI